MSGDAQSVCHELQHGGGLGIGFGAGGFLGSSAQREGLGRPAEVETGQIDALKPDRTRTLKREAAFFVVRLEPVSLVDLLDVGRVVENALVAAAPCQPRIGEVPVTSMSRLLDSLPESDMDYGDELLEPGISEALDGALLEK